MLEWLRVWRSREELVHSGASSSFALPGCPNKILSPSDLRIFWQVEWKSFDNYDNFLTWINELLVLSVHVFTLLFFAGSLIYPHLINLFPIKIPLFFIPAFGRHFFFTDRFLIKIHILFSYFLTHSRLSDFLMLACCFLLWYLIFTVELLITIELSPLWR